MSESYPSRILICGLGSIGRRHLRVINAMYPEFEISVLRSGLGKHCVEVEVANQIFTDLSDALLWKPHAAIICTPASDHLNKALPLAREGVPLLIEKPIGMGNERSSDWLELIDLSKIVPIEVGYVLRHDPCAAFTNKILQTGSLGNIIEADFYCGSWLPDWRPGIDYRNSVSAKQALGGGVLLELSHELDMARLFFGDIQIETSMLLNSGLLDIDTEDRSILIGRASPNLLVSFRLNFCSKPSRRMVTIRGCSGELTWNILEGTVCLITNDAKHSENFKSPVSLDQLYQIQAEHFLSCVTRQSTVLCSVSDALDILELVNTARYLNSLVHRS